MYKTLKLRSKMISFVKNFIIINTKKYYKIKFICKINKICKRNKLKTNKQTR